MRKRALSIRIMFGSKCECVSIAIHFAVGRIELRVYVLREEQRALPAYEEPPVLPGGSFLHIFRLGDIITEEPIFPGYNEAIKKQGGLTNGSYQYQQQ